MLIRFSVSNFLSFKDKVELNMLASNERIHPHHVYRTSSRNQPNMLRIATIYGANAAGKSNLVKAVQFARSLIIRGSPAEAKIPVERFRLDSSCFDLPAQFEFEFRVKNVNYQYTFSVNDTQVCAEKLCTTTNTRETLLFARETSRDGDVKVEWGAFIKQLSEKEKLFLEFVAQGTRPNQLLLHETIDRNIARFRPAYNWFRRTLQIIQPTTTAVGLELQLDADEDFREFLARVLRTSGTGISAVRMQELPLDTIPDLPNELINDARERVTEDRFIVVRGTNGNRFVVAKRGDDLRVLKLVTVHAAKGSSQEVVFDIHEESDGTQRLFDLVPMLHELTAGSSRERVYFVDEVDRSMHPHLTNLIVSMHLDEVNASRPSQLIITTHETNLLDLELLRRDEIWFAEKRADGSTDLYSLSDFQPRYDKDIRKDYLIGRYGGIPFIGSAHRLRLPIEKHENAAPATLE